jgi:hypothetical protein
MAFAYSGDTAIKARRAVCDEHFRSPSKSRKLSLHRREGLQFDSTLVSPEGNRRLKAFQSIFRLLGNETKATLYQINDQLLRFGYSFLPRIKSLQKGVLVSSVFDAWDIMKRKK